MANFTNLLLLGGCLAALSACSREATGQVVAIVNDQEISASDLNGQLRQMQIPDGTDKKVAQGAAVQSLVDRALVVGAAKARGVDKSPEFIQQQRRMNDDLMINLFAKQLAGTVGVPTQAEIDKFITDNPAMFAGRLVYNLDQLQVQIPADRTKLKPLESDHSMPAVMATLDRLGIKYRRQNTTFDTATAPPAMSAKIAALPGGEPFIIANGNLATINVITGKAANPLVSADARKLASDSIRQRKLSELSLKQVKDARTAAKITYQPGYEPKTPSAPAPKK